MKNGGIGRMLCVAQGHAVSHWESWVEVLGVSGCLFAVLQGTLVCLGF